MDIQKGNHWHLPKSDKLLILVNTCKFANIELFLLFSMFANISKIRLSWALAEQSNFIYTQISLNLKSQELSQLNINAAHLDVYPALPLEWCYVSLLFFNR